jgi:hypothetical protein
LNVLVNPETAISAQYRYLYIYFFRVRSFLLYSEYL